MQMSIASRRKRAGSPAHTVGWARVAGRVLLDELMAFTTQPQTRVLTPAPIALSLIARRSAKLSAATLKQ
jgi:hypothetical protein